MPELAADFCPSFCVTVDAIQPALLFNDAGELQAAAIERRSVSVEKRIPPQTFA
jgi:hypothetical protein